jgi:hypothetical protein
MGNTWYMGIAWVLVLHLLDRLFTGALHTPFPTLSFLSSIRLSPLPCLLPPIPTAESLHS